MITIHKHSVVVLLLLLAAGPAPASAAVPDGINYQAYLTDSTGQAINTDVSITFAAYNVAVGGAPLWVQSQSVTVDHGLFSVTLGNPVNPFPADLFDGPVYVGLVVDGEEMMPRRALTSSAYSFKSADADTLTGVTATALNQAAHVVDMANPHNVTAAQSGAATAADIAALQSQLNAALAMIGTLQANVASLQTGVSGNAGSIGALQASVSGNTANISSNAFAISGLQSAVDVIEDNTVLDLNNVLTLSTGNIALFTGVNVQVVNGTGTTDGAPNGVGNLIVGYDRNDSATDPICSLGEFDNQFDCQSGGGTWATNHKSGSHNVVVGNFNKYSRHSGLVVGFTNSITGEGAVSIGGRFNDARGLYSVVSGGQANDSSGVSASINGGVRNNASGRIASIVGGGGSFLQDANTASGDYSTICGGTRNVASGEDSTVSGGYLNTAAGMHSSISGGRENEAGGLYASISGGENNSADGEASSVAGGRDNTAVGDWSSVSGGRRNNASADTAWASGGDGNAASSPYASVSGGRQNTASGDYSSVSGGRFNQATGIAAVVSGGGGDLAAEGNTAAGNYSTVSGGQNRTATGESDWRAGSLFENF